MLLAPFALVDPASPIRRQSLRSRAVSAVHVPAWLITWAVGGALAVLLVPSLRGGGFGGATLPFWLLAAPLINIVWLTRSRWIAALRARRIRR